MIRFWSKLGRLALRPAAFVLVTAGAVGAGCVLGPTTGQQFNVNPQGYHMAFSGRSDTPATAVTAYVLANPQEDPQVGTYVSIGTTNTGSTPLDGHDTVPYYTWSLTSNALSSSQWPDGGLARFKVKSKYNGSSTPQTMTTFDNDGMACLFAEQNNPWRQAGNDCRSPYVDDTIITVVNTSLTPEVAQDGIIQYLGWGAYHFQQSDVPDDLQGQTLNYYDNIDAPGTLDLFKTQFGFPGAETRIIYYNSGDLGIGRDMHCKTLSQPGKLTITACYVTNYGRFNVVPFLPRFSDLDPQTVINQTINGQPIDNSPNQPVATVAMVKDPNLSGSHRDVQFMVYNEDGFLTQLAPLDNQGLQADPHSSTNANINVPDNCLACHGASATYTRAESGPTPIVGAAFLPFDPAAMIFSTSNPTYSQANMLPKIKTLNAMVWDTAPPQAVTTLLQGMYPVNGVPTGPKNGSSAFSDTYVPASWQNAPEGNKVGVQIYKEVIKPYCRTCHVTANGFIDFDSWVEFRDEPSIGQATCGGYGPMPHSEQTQTRFWKSPARAHLVNAFNMNGGCAP